MAPVTDKPPKSRLISLRHQDITEHHWSKLIVFKFNVVSNHLFLPQELLRQREVIQNIEKKTDEINTNLTTSQRHLNNIKSVFGGIKNWWSGKKDSASTSKESQIQSSLDSIAKKSEEGTNRDGAGGGADLSDRDLDSRFLGRSASPQYGGTSSLQHVQRVTGSAREEELDRNLGESLSRGFD